MSKFLIKLVTTFFFVGYLPFAPGTFGSFAGLLLYAAVQFNIHLLAGVSALIIFLGFLLSGKAAKLFDHGDPSCVVIDEVAGMFIAVFGLPFKIPVLVAGFIIFRIFDITKLPPANRFQLKRGSLGIMGDDLVAGVYTNFLLRAVLILIAK